VRTEFCEIYGRESIAAVLPAYSNRSLETASDNYIRARTQLEVGGGACGLGWRSCGDEGLGGGGGGGGGGGVTRALVVVLLNFLGAVFP